LTKSFKDPLNLHYASPYGRLCWTVLAS